MTDSDLRQLRDANRDDEILVSIINRLILCRRNGTKDYAARLEARVEQWKGRHIDVVGNR